MFNGTDSLNSRNLISILMELIFSSSTWLITECQPEPSGWNPVGALVSGASHYLCVDSQGAGASHYLWLCVDSQGAGASHYLCVDSQGCRTWVPVLSKTAMIRSKVIIKTQVYVYTTLFADLKASIVFSVVQSILAVQETLTVLKLP